MSTFTIASCMYYHPLSKNLPNNTVINIMVKKNMNDIISAENTVLPRSDSEDDFERICAILIPDQPMDPDEEEFVPPEATEEMLTKYQKFLLPRIPRGLESSFCEIVARGFSGGSFPASESSLL